MDFLPSIELGRLLLASLIVVAVGAPIFGIFLAPFTVNQNEFAVIERFRRFARAAGPGLRWRVRWLHRIAGTVNMQVRQLPVTVDTRTDDNVWVGLKIAVHTLIQLGRAGTNTIMVPHSPAALTDLASQIQNAMIVGHRIGTSQPPPERLPERPASAGGVGSAVAMKELVEGA
jgi:hypothetical protein